MAACGVVDLMRSLTYREKQFSGSVCFQALGLPEWKPLTDFVLSLRSGCSDHACESSACGRPVFSSLLTRDCLTRSDLKEDEDEEAEELVRDRRNPCHHFLIDRLACAPQGARLDDADEVVDGLKEGMEGNLPPEETAQASQASSSLTKKRKRGADRRPRNTAYKARVAGERGSLLRHAQSAASLSSASGAENALAKSHTRLGYRQTLRYFGVGY